jgi:hypothetical protein
VFLALTILSYLMVSTGLALLVGHFIFAGSWEYPVPLTQVERERLKRWYADESRAKYELNPRGDRRV